MSRMRLRVAHATAGGTALATTLAFWTSTVIVELAGSAPSIVTVKHAIAWGLLLLVPAMAVTGMTGMRLTRNSRGRLVRRKTLRMRVVAAIGALVLVPCVLFLAAHASVDHLDAAFYAVQTIELAAGATNITLLGLNIRDGLRLTGRLRPGAPPKAARLMADAPARTTHRVV